MLPAPFRVFPALRIALILGSNLIAGSLTAWAGATPDIRLLPLPSAFPAANLHPEERHPAGAVEPGPRAAAVAERLRALDKLPDRDGTPAVPAAVRIIPPLPPVRAAPAQVSGSNPSTPSQPSAKLHIALHAIGTPRQMQRSAITENGGTGIRPALQAAAPGRRDEDTVRAFLWNFRDYLRLDHPDNELQLLRRQTDELGRRHFRYAQRYRGLPVWPAELIVHLDTEGNVDLMSGAHVPTPRKIPSEPVISGAAAAERARRAVPLGRQATVSGSGLIVYAAPDRPARLAWKLGLDVSTDARWLVVVDALTGRVLSTHNTVEQTAARGSGNDLFGLRQTVQLWEQNGKFWLLDTSKPMFQLTTDPVRDARGAIQILDANRLPATNDPEGQPLPTLLPVTSNRANGDWLSDAVSAAVNFSLTYDYFLTRHGRDSFDDHGSSIRGVVRLARNYPNAFWSSDNKTMFFGDAEPYAGSLDVVAHELAHGVTDYSARLVYQGQSGALNEAFSDIFGEMTEAYATGGTDWVIGSQLSEPIRDMKDPQRLAIGPGLSYPTTMSEYIVTSEDNGGVHFNSSIINRAYYLLAEGMDGAIGLGKAERIFYRALTVHLTARAQFVDARLGCIRAAEELFGTGSPESARTAAAFGAVEITESTPTTKDIRSLAMAGRDSAVFVFLDQETLVPRLGRRETTLGDGTLGTILSAGTASLRNRPSVTANGRKVLFVDAFNDICTIRTRGVRIESCLGFDFVHAVSLSPDGKYYAYLLLDTEGRIEPYIHIYDARADRLQTFDLLAPASEGRTVASVMHADAMDFTLNGRYLVYDALNKLTLEDGTELGAWSIYAIDLATGNLLTVVPPVPGFDIAYPALGKTGNSLIVFEARDQESEKSQLYTGNLNTGERQPVGNELSGGFSIPVYNGDDRALIYADVDPFSATGFSLWRLPLQEDHLTAAGQPELWLRDAMLGTVYRRGGLFSLRVSKTGKGSGTVTGIPQSAAETDVKDIECGLNCTYLYPPGTQAILKARADYGSVFAGWEGDCESEKTSCRVTVGKKRNRVVAVFKPAPIVILKVKLDFRTGSGKVVGTDGGIDCGSRCRGKYFKNAQVMLTAVPDPGSRFVGWYGPCRHRGEQCTLDLKRNTRVTANFAAD